MKTMLSFVSLFLVAACASQTQNAKVDIQPDVTIEQLSSAPAAAEHVSGGMPVQYRMTVTNTAQIPITLKQMNVQSLGAGAYTVPQTSRPFNLVIPPGGTEATDFWVPAYAGSSVAGNNGAVALRLMTQYESPSGSFQHVTVSQVMGRIQ